MIDVDHFRQYNNRFRHQTGDEVLRRVARLIAEHRRVNDVVARYGGEEFALLLINADHRVARRLAERLRLRVQSEPFPRRAIFLAGVSRSRWSPAVRPMATRLRLIAAADAALFRAKRAGRNLVCVAGETTPGESVSELAQEAGDRSKRGDDVQPRVAPCAGKCGQRCRQGERGQAIQISEGDPPGAAALA